MDTLKGITSDPFASPEFNNKLKFDKEFPIHLGLKPTSLNIQT